MSTEDWRKVVESAPKSDVWTDTYRTGPSEDTQARLDAEWNAAVEAAAKLAANEADRIGNAPVDGGAVAWVSRAIRALKRGGK